MKIVNIRDGDDDFIYVFFEKPRSLWVICEADSDPDIWKFGIDGDYFEIKTRHAASNIFFRYNVLRYVLEKRPIPKGFVEYETNYYEVKRKRIKLC